MDDHPLFREALAGALQAEPDLEVVGEAGSTDELFALVPRIDPDVAIVDLILPSVSGIGVTRELRELLPQCRVLALSAVVEAAAIAEMLRAGASGFALKTQPAPEILDGIRRTAAGETYLPSSLSREAIDAALAGGAPPSLAQLTQREREIFELMIHGYSNPEIASRLSISPRTVETHRHRIVKKLGARSVFEMQRLAARYGWSADTPSRCGVGGDERMGCIRSAPRISV